MALRSKNKATFIKFISSPVIIAFVTALITSLVAPYLIQLRKERVTELQQEKEKNNQILKSQFEIIENMSRNIGDFRQAAEFLIFDYQNGQPNEDILKRHIQHYDEATASATKGLSIEAFRARMYFQDSGLFYKLMGTFGDLFKTLNRIDRQQFKQGYKIVQDRDAQAEWGQIHEELVANFDKIRVIMDELFAKTGTIK